MRWNKLKTVIAREYNGHVRRKLFWIMTFVGPLLPIGIGAFAGYMASHVATGQRIRIYDGANLGPGMESDLSEAKITAEILPWPAAAPDEHDEMVRKPLLDKAVDATLLIPPETGAGEGKSEVKLCVRKGGNLALEEIVSHALTSQLRQKAFGGKGVAAGEVAKIFALRASVQRRVITEQGIDKDASALAGFFSAMLITLMSMMPTIIWGQQMMRSIIEEKNQRIIEILISSLTSTELMVGKIMGTGLAGLTQITLWFALSLSLGGGALAVLQIKDFSIAQIMPPSLLPIMLIFFCLGFFVYALLFAAAASAVNSDQDAQQLAGPITILMMVPWILVSMSAQAPGKSIVTVLSFIPFFTPVLMTMRAGVGVLPWWQACIGVALTVGLIALLMWICAKIFRVGILMYGQKPSLAEVVKWIGRS